VGEQAGNLQSEKPNGEVGCWLAEDLLGGKIDSRQNLEPKRKLQGLNGVTERRLLGKDRLQNYCSKVGQCLQIQSTWT